MSFIGTAPCGSFYSIVPNPAQNIVTIAPDERSVMAAKTGAGSLSAGSITQIKIYRSNGQILKTIQYPKTTKQVKVNVADLEPGLYFIEISNGNIKQTEKVVITR